MKATGKPLRTLACACLLAGAAVLLGPAALVAQEQAEPSPAPWWQRWQQLAEQWEDVQWPAPPEGQFGAQTAGSDPAPAPRQATVAPAPESGVTAEPLAAAQALPQVSLPDDLAFVTTDDPQDTPGSPLDIKQVRHADTATHIVYEAEMWAELPESRLSELGWLLNFDGSGSTDACVSTRWDGSRLRGFVFGKGCAGASFEEVTMTKTGPATFRVVYPISALQSAGFSGTSYRYRVQSNFGESVAAIATDKAPDEGQPAIAHELGGTVTPGEVLSPRTGQPEAASVTTGTGSTTTTTSPATSGESTTTKAATTRAAGTDRSDMPSSGAPIAVALFSSMVMLGMGGLLVGTDRYIRRPDGPAWEWAVVVPEARLLQPPATPLAVPALPAPVTRCALPAPRQAVAALPAPPVAMLV